MKYKIMYQFDPVFETLGLLHSIAEPMEKETVIQQFNELGFDAERCYKKYYKLMERYIRIFKRHMAPWEEDSQDFFFRRGDEFCLLMAVLITENAEWMDSLDSVSDEEIRGMAGFLLQDDEEQVASLKDGDWPQLGTEKEIIDFLTDLHAEEGFKWHLLEFMRRPKDWMAKLTEMLAANIPACEKALAEMGKALDPFLRSYENNADKQVSQMKGIFAQGSFIYPTLIGGMSQQIYYTKCYQGVFMEYLVPKGGSGDEQKELVITRMKALSDRSKLDILCELKKSRQYNLELAENMKLSPSTMSHHMNVLFACGFVGIEKKDGRVYYYLQEEAVEEYLDHIRQLLL